MQVEQAAMYNIAKAKKISYIKSNTAIEQKQQVHPGPTKLPEK